jgi:hypothetical protein
MRKTPGLLALSAVALALTACGGSVSVGSVDTIASKTVSGGIGPKVLDRDGLETMLADQLAPQGGMTPKDITVRCPDDIPMKRGHDFDCTLTVKSDGSKVVVKVTETNDTGHVTGTIPDQKVITAP